MGGMRLRRIKWNAAYYDVCFDKVIEMRRRLYQEGARISSYNKGILEPRTWEISWPQ